MIFLSPLMNLLTSRRFQPGEGFIEVWFTGLKEIRLWVRFWETVLSRDILNQTKHLSQFSFYFFSPQYFSASHMNLIILKLQKESGLDMSAAVWLVTLLEYFYNLQMLIYCPPKVALNFHNLVLLSSKPTLVYSILQPRYIPCIMPEKKKNPWYSA